MTRSAAVVVGLAVVLSSPLLLAPREAGASGFFISQIGGPDASPTDPDPTAVFWNPAALGGIEGLQIQADLVSILRFAHYNRSVDYEWNAQSKSWQQTAGSEEQASLFNYIPLPFLGLALPLTDRFAAGLAFYSPFGSSSSWDDADGPQAYHSITGSNTAVFFSGALSYRVLRWLHAGVTVSYVSSSASSERKAEFSDIVGGLPEDPSLLAKMELRGFSGYSFSAEFGVLLDFDWLRIGLAYQPPIPISNNGRIVLTPIGDKIKEVIGDRPAEADAEMSYTLPDNVKASVDVFVRRDLRLRLYVEYVNWSHFDAIEIDVKQRTLSLIPEKITDEHNFNDAFGLSGQVKYWPREHLGLFAGFGFDMGAIPDETHSSLFIDSNKIAASIGVDLRALRFARTKLGCKYVHYLERTVRGSERVPVADGVYGSDVVMIDLNVTYLGR